MGEPGLEMSVDAYLALDDASPEKHEFWDGHVFAMGGASLAHNRIVRNLIRHLGNALEGSGCEPLPSDLRVRITDTERYVYPDVTVVCGPPQLEGSPETLINPRLVFEVLSQSTAAFDRGDKFAAYRGMPTVHEVVFLSQDEPRVECYTRQDDGTWLLREVGAGANLPLSAGPSRIPVARIYDGVELPGEPTRRSS